MQQLFREEEEEVSWCSGYKAGSVIHIQSHLHGAWIEASISSMCTSEGLTSE